MIAKIAESSDWLRMWDKAVSGLKAVIGLQALSRDMSLHGRGSHPCHLCDAAPLQEPSVSDHLLCAHREELHLQSNYGYSHAAGHAGKVSTGISFQIWMHLSPLLNNCVVNLYI